MLGVGKLSKTVGRHFKINKMHIYNLLAVKYSFIQSHNIFHKYRPLMHMKS